MLIYKVKNKKNNKVYIGKTTKSLEDRKKAHYKNTIKCETNFGRALKKYPEDTFEWSVLEEVKNKKNLDKKEMYYINQFDTYNKGYNMTLGGGGGLTYNTESENYNRIKSKLGKWKNGNPGSTPEAIEKRMKTFMTLDWKSGESHGNSGHIRSKGKSTGKDNPMYKKYPYLQSVEVDGIVYESLGEASRNLGVTRATVRKRCENERYKNWRKLSVTKQTKF